MRASGTVHPCVILIATSAILCILLAGCPVPIDVGILNRVKDETGPGLVITEPADGSSFASTVIVSGQVADFSTTDGESGQVVSVQYSVAPTLVPGGSVDVADDGTFAFSFSTDPFSTSMLITVIATDWNGNETAATISLMNEGAVPSFASVPGNKSATLTWDPVPLSESYSLYYTTNGTYPSESYGYGMDNVESPLMLSNLQNGSLHVFLLQSHSSSGGDNWSEFVKAIPLSPLTLAPVVEPEYEQLRVTWAEIPGAGQFEVWRSTSPAVGYRNYSGTVIGSIYLDTSVDAGTAYFYKVKPAVENANLSESGSGSSCAFPAV
ncbi:MAG: hypothetical protein KAU31_12015, partial [Spirochaetaceae bacterium]|nr:hypothetical protein [Spirochaetaceae bacterium]